MAWDSNLLPAQRIAASHAGRHARLLAGPGTGKTLTLTRRVLYLVEELDCDPRDIVALTFTRAAAAELRGRVDSELSRRPEDKELRRRPRISTLHSYALRQIIRNSHIIDALPRPLRILDDFEERHFLLEDLKSMLGLTKVAEVASLINRLAMDWQTLTVEEADWEKKFVSPKFLGAWREHREIYGYTLRAELVYQLKKGLELRDDFDLEGPPDYLLVDEYQDLNRCDLAIVASIADLGAEVYAAGDDDQSIYGFRGGHPAGIRRFPEDFDPNKSLDLDVCKRCDELILDWALFVARQDHERLEKPLSFEAGREGGVVALIRFSDQDEEASGVALICDWLIRHKGLRPEDVLILLRTDTKRVFSKPLIDALSSRNISVTQPDPGALFDQLQPRLFLACLRLVENIADSVSWRTIMECENNGLGTVAIEAVYNLAKQRGGTFANALVHIFDDHSIVSKGARIAEWYNQYRSFIESAREELEANEDRKRALWLLVEHLFDYFGIKEDLRYELEIELDSALGEVDEPRLSDLLRGIAMADNEVEQSVVPGKVNILTMHRAKGLTAKATIIVAAEDEYLPGRAEGDAVGDERRLLYVSLSRAQHFSFVTYCQKRTGQQSHTGRTSGTTIRNLTRFLRDGPVDPVRATDFVFPD